MSGKPRGSGLGLPICTEIIRQFGGKIWVESELTEGATFTFRIPIAKGAKGVAKGVGDKWEAFALLLNFCESGDSIPVQGKKSVE
jgi:hypothetical protein